MKKILRAIVVLVLALSVMMNIGGCSIKGNTYTFKEVKVKWGKSITKFEKEFILENGCFGIDEFDDDDELFKAISKEYEDNYKKKIIDFSSDGEEVYFYLNQDAFDNNVKSATYEVEDENGYLFFISSNKRSLFFLLTFLLSKTPTSISS